MNDFLFLHCPPAPGCCRSRCLGAAPAGRCPGGRRTVGSGRLHRRCPGYQTPAAQIPAQFSSASLADASQVGELACARLFHRTRTASADHQGPGQQSVTCAPPCLRVEQARAATALRADRVPAGGPGLICSAHAPGDPNFTGRPIASSQHQLGGRPAGDRPVGRVRNMNEAALQTYLAGRRRANAPRP